MGIKIEKILLLLIFLNVSFLFADSKDPMQFVKENRIKWFDEKFINELVQACERIYTFLWKDA